ncbi:Sec7-domain-containing protein [Hymenopellis radicata]|nr:Sec7-domain-containing protein [Hymenopellis radicata]
MSTRRTVSQKHVLYSEILSVTSAMRKNSRWAATTYFMNTRASALGSNMGLRMSTPVHDVENRRSLNKEIDLMAGFQELKRAMRDVEDVSSVPLPSILGPFFAIIRSPLSTGPITSAALSSLHKFFTCGIISTSSVDLDAGLVELSSTVSHCKFEPSDSSGDEVVLLKIMAIIQDCLCGFGSVLGDVEVCEMLETVLTTACQMRLSETLRRSAEFTMNTLVQTCFSRLHVLDAASEEEKLNANLEDIEGEVKMSVATDDVSFGDDASTSAPEPPVSAGPRVQYGLPSILELLRVLVNVLDPNDQKHTDSTRLTVLGILNTAFEEAGPRIPDFPSLKALIIDPGCKFLFQLARSDNTSVLHAALRTISTMFDTMRRHLNYLCWLTAAGTPAPDTPLLAPTEPDKDTSTQSRPSVPPAQGQTRDLLLETLNQIARHSSFMVDVYTNYDCDINCENLLERLIEFLTKSVYPIHHHDHLDIQQQNAQFLCLDLLLAFVNDMVNRAQGASQPWPSEYPAPESLMQIKSQKKLVLSAASKFNAKPKTGLAFLEENGLIYADLSSEMSKAQSLAKFLKSCSRLDKRLLGDFISKPDNIEILRAFIGLFDFKDKPMADAMRELLEAFRLPGEAQQISRITETYASIYFATQPAEIKSEDAVFVLAFAVIMLNTDQHNPQVRKRMSFEDFQKNLRGVNNGGDFSPAYLQNIYDSIRKHEIVMPEEHTGQLGFEYAWKELLTRSRQAGDLMVANTSHFDIDIFKSVWKPVISAIAYAFITFDDDYIIQRSVAGFRQCATLAGNFLLPDVFDFVVVSLSQATGLLSENLPAQVPNYPVVDVEGQSVTVSNLSVKFGTNFKGQLAAVVLFNIVNGNGNALREGWTQIFEMFQNLFLRSLLPTRMLQMEDFLGGVSMIPLRGSQPQRQASRNEGGGLLSALSSYLMTPYSASSEALPEATDSDVENTLCTIDCVASCRLDELYSQIMHLDLHALIAAIRALEALAHDRTIAKLRQESSDDGNPAEQPFSLPYDPASVFLLETMVSIACQTPQDIEDLWPIVFEHLSGLLSTPEQYSVLLVERAVVGLLRLCLIVAQFPSLRDQLYVSFDLLAGLKPVIANSVAEQIISGLVLIVQKHQSVIRSQTEWNLVFVLMRSTISHPEASRLSFDLITNLVSEGPEQHVSPDNLPGLVQLLDDFVSTAGLTIENQQHRGRRRDATTATSTPQLERGKKAVDLLVTLKKWLSTSQVPSMSKEQVWRQLWLPLLSSLSRQSTNASREIRHNSMSQLQRILLGPHEIFSDSSDSQREEIFNRVVFPLLDELLKPQVFIRDPPGMPESRLRASALLCKTFMHFEVRESSNQSDIRILWIQILDLLDRLMNADRGDQLYEAIPESLKNVILVMQATQMLVPPSADDKRSQEQRTLWTATAERMERFLPGFLTEIIPPPLSEPPSESS